VLEDGEPADPGAFLTSIPNWKPGDEFLAGRALVKYRIVAIDDEDPPPDFSGIFVVAPA
jgi:hypothetical protein